MGRFGLVENSFQEDDCGRGFPYPECVKNEYIILTVNPSLKYNPNTQEGPVAQLGARINRTDEVAGSNPARSTRAWAHGAAGSAPQWH